MPLNVLTVLMVPQLFSIGQDASAAVQQGQSHDASQPNRRLRNSNVAHPHQGVLDMVQVSAEGLLDNDLQKDTTQACNCGNAVTMRVRLGLHDTIMAATSV